MGLFFSLFLERSTEYLEYGTAVECIAYFLLLLCEVSDELFSKNVAFLEEVMLRCEFLGDNLWLRLAITYSGKTFLADAMLHEILNNGLGTALRKVKVIYVHTSVVAVCSKFDGYVGVVVKECDEFIKRHS